MTIYSNKIQSATIRSASKVIALSQNKIAKNYPGNMSKSNNYRSRAMILIFWCAVVTNSVD
jgi:hypothetical protein